MTFIAIKRLSRLAPALAALAIVAGTAEPAFAVQCTSDLLTCYQQSATIDSFWARTAAALDCELTYVQCVREAAFGY